MVDNKKWEIKWVRSTNFLSILTLFFSSILFFQDLFKERYLLSERDLGPYFIPPRFFWVESIKNGDFPLWNPYQFSGHPFFANPQHAILYPLNSLFFILPFDVAFNSIIILHFFLGGLFTYIFLKDLKVSSTGALISGLIFMLSGYLLSVHSLLSCLFSVIWTPLIIMFFRRAITYPKINNPEACSRVSKLSPPLTGGDEGEGDKSSAVTPTLTLPHQGGGNKKRSFNKTTGNDKFKNMVFTAIFLTISFLGGGVEIVYGIFFILFFMVIFSTSPYSPDSPVHEGLWRRIRRGVKSLLIVSILFLFLSAVQLAPFIELLYHSIRRGGISYQEATIWSFAPKDILLFFLPDAYGYFLDMKKYWVTQCWLKTLYTGGLPFILSAIFFIFGKGRKLFFSLMFFSVFLSLGHYNPLYAFVFKYVPFFNGIRYPVKFLYIFILVLSITAGLGFERLKTFLEEGEAKKLKIIFTVLSLICGFFLLFLVLGNKEIEHFMRVNGIDFPNFYYASVNLYNTKRVFFYLTLFFLLLRVGHEVKWKGWVKILLILALTADLFGNMGFYGKEKTSDYFQKTKVLEIISSDKGQFRTFSTSRTISMDIPILIGDGTYINYLKEKHLPSMSLLYKLHDIWGIDVIHLKRTDDLYRSLIDTPSISATNLIDLMSVKYVISVTLIEKDPRFELIYARLEGLKGKKENLLKENTIKLYRNKDPLPRGWLVKDFKIMNSKDILSTITKKDFKPVRVVLLEEKPKFNPSSPPFYPSFSSENLQNEVELISESNNKLRLFVKAKENTFLVLNDTYFPNWKVFVDGKKEKILRADYSFRAVPLNAGKHQVEFVYDPFSFKLGAVITFVGIIGCLVIGLLQKKYGSQP